VAFKLHLISFILKTLHKETNGEGRRIDSMIEVLLKSDHPERGIGDMLDRVLRQGVREFKFRETTVMQQLVANLAHTQVFTECLSILQFALSRMLLSKFYVSIFYVSMLLL